MVGDIAVLEEVVVRVSARAVTAGESGVTEGATSAQAQPLRVVAAVEERKSAVPMYDIRQGDALKHLRALPSESVQLIVTSPPYNVGKSYEKRTSYDEYLIWQTAIIEELVRVLEPGGSICWQVGNGVQNGEVIPLDAVFYPVFKGLGLKMRNRIIWSFGHGLHATKRFSGRHESIMWFTKGDDYTFNLDAVRVPSKYPMKRYFKGPRKGEISGNPLGKNPGDVWDIPNVKANHPEKTAHPCQFPVALVERLVLALSSVGDTVLDPFMGSGTTAIAAVKNGRRGIGFDNTAEYVKIAKVRLSLLEKGLLKTRPLGQPIYEPPTASER